MGLPILFLFIFLGRSVSLEGSGDGIKEYIGIWDLKVLQERGDVWSTAVSQIFFSIGVTFGIMTAYGSHCPRTEPAFMNTCVIAFSNSMFSFIAGFAVFAALGHLAHLEDTKVTDLPISGFGLVFGTWPVVFGTLPGGEHWVRLLFFMLFLLGIDSAFSFLEAGLTVAKDTAKRFYPNLNNATLTAGSAAVGCFIAFLFTLIYATDAGLIFLDTIDFYINFVMIFVGFLETFAAGWIYGIEEQIESLGREAVFTYMLANFGSVLLGSALWFGVDVDNAVWAGFVGMILFYAIGIGATMYFLDKVKTANPEKFPTWTSIIYEISAKNIMDMKYKMEPVIGMVPTAWCFLVKQIIPHILLILFINLAQTQNKNGDPIFSNYEGYEAWPYQVLGILTFAFACFLFIIGFFFPDVYKFLVDESIYTKAEQVKEIDDVEISKEVEKVEEPKEEAVPEDEEAEA